MKVYRPHCRWGTEADVTIVLLCLTGPAAISMHTKNNHKPVLFIIFMYDEVIYK